MWMEVHLLHGLVNQDIGSTSIFHQESISEGASHSLLVDPQRFCSKDETKFC